MRDPHVEALHYRLVPSERVTFENPPPLEAQRPGFDLRLADEQLRIEMRDHYASEEEARQAVEPYLRAWEIKHALWAGSSEIRFDFERSEIVDRDPPPPPKAGERHFVVVAEAASAVATAGSVSFHIGRRSYPDPPEGFAVDPDVETLWRRWEGYLAGRESLQQMAFFCLTVLQLHGGRSGAATRFAISAKVLSTLARLSTETGDTATARKATPKLRPLSGEERAWLEAAVKALVRRAGEVAAAPTATLPQVTMADLPQL